MRCAANGGIMLESSWRATAKVESNTVPSHGPSKMATTYILAALVAYSMGAFCTLEA